MLHRYSLPFLQASWTQFVTQELIPIGGTIAPVIIASDKTQLTQFSGSKAAYPVYLTIGNIPKAIWRKPGARACVLLAYLSVDKVSKERLSKTGLRLRNYEIFHRSMAIILQPLKAAGNPAGPGVLGLCFGDNCCRDLERDGKKTRLVRDRRAEPKTQEGLNLGEAISNALATPRGSKR